MNIIFWVILGGIAGWLASILMKTNAEQGTITDIVLGIVGAIVGGYVMNFFGKVGVNGFNLYSLVVATIGAVIVIAVGRLLRKAA